jgi:hypothetical protein
LAAFPTGATFWCSALWWAPILTDKFISDWKIVPGEKALAYFDLFVSDELNRFSADDTWANVLKLFTAVSYEFL